MELPHLIKPNGVYIADHHSLMDLANAFVYAGESIESLRSAVDGYFKAIEDGMNKRIEEFQLQLQQAQKELRSAQLALSSCQRSCHYDEDGDYVEPNCSCEERDVKESQKEVDRIQKIIEKLENLKSDIEQELYEYRQPFGIITPGGGDGVLAAMSETYSKDASKKLDEIIGIVNEYQNVNISKNGYTSSTNVDEESSSQTQSKAEKFREASERILQKQREDDFGNRQVIKGNSVVLCMGCHRPIVACICPHGPRQLEHINNYSTSR